MINKRILSRLLSIPVVVTIALSIPAHDTHCQENIKPQQAGNLPGRPVQESRIAVKVLPQPGSSLRFANVIDKTSDPRMPEIVVDMENVGTRSVVAYTTRTEMDCGSGFSLSNITSKEKMILPWQSQELTFGGSGCSGLVNSVTLSVDFIEFEDGTYWGEDTHKSRQRLAGMRAGARDETSSLNAIVKALDARVLAVRDETNWMIPPNRTAEWIRGYKIGRNLRRSQIERAFSESGIQGAKDRLSLPFDASGKEEE